MLNRSQIRNLFECLFEILQEYANRDWTNAKFHKILSGTLHRAFLNNRNTIANEIFRSCLIPPIASAEVPCEAYGVCCVQIVCTMSPQALSPLSVKLPPVAWVS